MILALSTDLAAIAVAIAVIGALAGSAGFAWLVVHRQQSRLAKLAERLSRGEALDARDLDRISHERLRAGFGSIGARLAETWRMATIDPLTEILNRQALLHRLAAELDRAARYSRPLSIILVDLDHFKRLNDSHGHVAGDIVLHEVARVLRDNVRSVDVLGRYGGEEFMVVLPETDVDDGAALAEKLRRLVASCEIALDDGHTVSLTLSAGVAGGPGAVLRLDALIRDADAALYSAKSFGRDQVFVFAEPGEDDPIRSAPIGVDARARAVEVGRAAMTAAAATLTAALDSRPAWAGKPSTMIAEAAVEMARALDLPDGELDRIRLASLLHDLGKLAIPDEILGKPDDLAEPEWRVVTEHPKIGQVVLEQAGALRDAATIVLHHHEWFDGRGYPHGLSGPEIPIGARIVAIADAYEAMVAGRPYRDSVDHEAAIAELRRHAGLQFDPDLVEVFAGLFPHGVPWPIEPHRHDHAQDGGADAGGQRHGHVVAFRNHAEAHDATHALRRSSSLSPTGIA
jgi:diguanylate cyclase (GGDEF)-like protein